MNIYPTSQLPGRKALLDNGKEYLWFSGTDYLGMGHHEGFLSYLREGITNYGTHFGSSRNNSLRLSVYEEAEMALAKFAGAPMALTTASGMWAGQLVMKELPRIMALDGSGPDGSGLDGPGLDGPGLDGPGLDGPGLYLPTLHYHYAPGVHPALWGPDYRSEKMGWSEWATNMVSKIQDSGHEDMHMICSDSVGSPFVERFDFSILKALPFYRQIFLVIDDSHGLGVLGKSGNGVYQELSAIQQAKLIVVSSLNKALGIPGGVMLGDRHVIAAMHQSPWFSGASPVVPAYMYALKKLLENGIYEAAHRHLLDNITYVAERLRQTKLFVQRESYPVFCSLDGRLFDYLEENGILASCFSYPKPTDAPVTRLVISALHKKEDLDRLAEVCMKF